ncbi:hypothetical protein GLOTRDRAFT_140715 [Gloeophyllum trabeum ATCC 11539]|uniref:CBS domain-containing protein n=1 Tax=Gloeophyllum trabeum (strain ATCC 11539 / FP-39264 / Madison 617) TaxID=670483 RepID=S7PXN2_GLOTA|nr:uncharacterized protein GLOTRDRAFT_140715 [Gloeophyllum trabeum ATCC 11539]EPQ52371.1 hypothetical protein GLOTRDRAFT_140715 [Gloeophyllum trabeum ATCC 11539]
MAQNKRLSISSARSVAVRSPSPIAASVPSTADSDEWVKAWQGVLANDLIDSPVVAVDADTTVEDACELLLSKDLACLAVKAPADRSSSKSPFVGLFDFADVNAFLTLAATRHTLHPDYLRDNPRIHQIVEAAKSGPDVPVYLVSNLSEKNPLEILPHDATIISLLGVFCKGTHRVLISSPSSSTEFLGFVSDRSLLSWFSKHAQETPSFAKFISNPLNTLSLPSINLYVSVVATTSTATLLDAMRLMSDQGVSSVAVIEGEGGFLHSAISVTDIGKVVVPSQSPQILSTPLHQVINLIKEPYGATDGNERYPVYSASPNSPLSYAIEKILATNSHRLFITSDSTRPTSPGISGKPNHVCGIVSVVDILSLFARIANVPDVDPTRMQRHRRASSASSSLSSRSSMSGSDAFARSRSGSRTSVSSPTKSGTSLDGSFVWADRVPQPSTEKK